MPYDINIFRMVHILFKICYTNEAAGKTPADCIGLLYQSKGCSCQMKELVYLFLLFARIGGLTFGGGYAMLPILQRELVDNRHWVTEEELADYYAIGQCTPGIIAVNTATFVGAKRKGIIGGIVATIGVVFPAMIIISIIAAFLQNFADYPVVIHAFAGIRVCVCVLILNAIIKLWKKAVIDLPTLIIFLVVALGSVFTTISPVIYVIGAAVAGIIIQNIRAKSAGAAKGGKD